MILKDITYAPYKLPFRKNFATSKDTYNFRRGFIIKITDELNNIGLGEASPLENFGTDTFENAAKSLTELKNNFINTDLTDNFTALSNFSRLQKFSPTVHFAFDQSLISLLLKRNQNSLPEIFSNRKTIIPVNFVIGLEDDSKIFSELKIAIDNGFKTFKFKVGRKNFASDVRVISEIRESYGDLINIRIDANGNWSYSDAEQIVRQFEKLNIQFIEQPVKEISDICKLSQLTSVPVAPDECIKNFADVKYFLGCEKINFIVLKPSLFGSIFNTLNLIEEVEKSGKTTIISSALETAVGRSAVSFIASFVKHNFAHGLDTAKFFKDDTENNFYKIKNGLIDISEYPPEF